MFLSRKARVRDPLTTQAMPPPSDHPCLHLILLDKKFFVVEAEKLDAALLAELSSGKSSVFSITRTPEEISVAGEAYEGMSKTFEENSGWRCIKIAGPMEFSETCPLFAL